jgi:hypothetical protein
MGEPFVLSLGSTLFVPVKRLAQLLPIDLNWDRKANVIAVVAGSARPAAVAVTPGAVTKPAPVAVVRRPPAGSAMPLPGAEAGGLAALTEVTVDVVDGKVHVHVRSSQPVNHTELYLKQPPRIVVDFPNARWATDAKAPVVSGAVRSARLGHPTPAQARLVMEVTSPAVKLAGVELEANGLPVAAVPTVAPRLLPQLAPPVSPAPFGRNEKILEALKRRSARTPAKGGYALALQSRGGNLNLGTGGTEQPVEPGVTLPTDNAWQYIVVHHSASPSGNAAAFDAMHRRKGWDGLAYHFVITNGKGGTDGELEVSPRWTSQKHGAHAGAPPGNARGDVRNGFNEFGIGICLVGNFEQKAPSEKQLQTLAQLIQELRSEFSIPAENVLGHGTVKGTACPGGAFPWKRLFELMGLPAPQHLHRHPPTLTTSRCPWCQERTPEK